MRLPRHGASCPVGMGVSCSADRNIKAKINRHGIWIEKLESNPGKYIPESLRQAGEGEAVKVNLNQPMSEILALLSPVPGIDPSVAQRYHHRGARYRPREAERAAG
ncbi:Fumarate hydratase class I, anaerobic [Raoultella ornithinolytica]|nr:Fumarate hydratase class I, anaerobic [Raoultella ornithinolytica]